MELNFVLNKKGRMVTEDTFKDALRKKCVFLPEAKLDVHAKELFAAFRDFRQNRVGEETYKKASETITREATLENHIIGLEKAIIFAAFGEAAMSGKPVKIKISQSGPVDGK